MGECFKHPSFVLCFFECLKDDHTKREILGLNYVNALRATTTRSAPYVIDGVITPINGRTYMGNWRGLYIYLEP